MAFATIVARASPERMEYLVRETRRAQWVPEGHSAARFHNLREATRAALRPPSSFRA